jgi:hypothetical protein
MIGVAIPAVMFEQAAPVVCKGHGTIAPVEGDSLNESLVFEMAQIALANVERGIARVAQIPLRYDPKRPDGRQCSRIRSPQLVVAVAVVNQLALRSSRQVEIAHEHVARVHSAIVDSNARFTIARLATIVVAIADVVLGRTNAVVPVA